MKILAIDPGTRFAGYAVMAKNGRSIQLSDYGLLKIKTTNGWAHRVGVFYDLFKEKIKEHSITDICFETAFMYKNAATFMKLGYMRGIIYLLAHEFKLQIHEYTPTTIKQAVCARGNATKEQVASMVYKYFPKLKRPLKDDVTDSIGCGICHFNISKYSKNR